MIRPTVALRLASTKLRVRKIWLIITIIVCSLMFAILSFASFIVTGTINSLEDFGREGYGSRFLVQAMPATYQPQPDETELVAKLESEQRDLVAQKKQLAKQLGLTYDETTDQSLPINVYKAPSGATQKYPNFSSPIVQKAYEARNATIPGTSFEDFKQTAAAAGATSFYRSSSGLNFMSGGINGISVLVNGRENMNTEASMPNGPPRGVNTISAFGWRMMSKELLAPFVLEGQNTEMGTDKSIPIIAPMSAAEEILELKSLPDSATSQQKLDRLIKVRTEIAGKTAQLCYRNSSSVSLLQQAVQQQKEIEQNKNKKDYVRPSLEYQVPETACGAVTVKRDVRTSDEKKQANNQKIFNQKFGEPEPTQGLITVRIIGLTPDISYQPSLGATAILQSLLGSSLGLGWFSPQDAIAANPTAIMAQGGTLETFPRSQQTYYAEFPTLASAKEFIKNQTCDPSANNSPDKPFQPNNNIKQCIEAKKVFNVSPYGNSAGAVEEFRHGISKVLVYVILGIVVVAAVVLMGTLGKIIADSRRETAVFRALGAKRLDIAQVYITYTLLLSSLIAVLAITTGAIAAHFLSQRIAPDLSVNAILTYGAKDVHKQFTTFGFNGQYILVVIGLVMAAGLLSTILPLLMNLRRNPIRDMRNDT